jgi:glycerol-3-phosphate dehydrogenase
VHVSVSRDRLPADVAAVFSVPHDRRSVFVVPFQDGAYTYVGTTDTAYEGSLDDPLCTPGDVAYLLSAVNASTSSNLVAEDVTGVWAGLRPLLAPAKGKKVKERTADLSRRHRVTDSRDGVIHITGGKWTTYRQMAQDAVDALAPYVSPLKGVRTKSLSLFGVGEWRPTNERERHLYRRYGEQAQIILAMIDDEPALGASPIDDQTYLAAEFVFSAQREMVTSLTDLLTRRSRAHLQNARTAYDAADAVARLVASTLGWDEDEIPQQIAAYKSLVEEEFAAAGLRLR